MKTNHSITVTISRMAQIEAIRRNINAQQVQSFELEGEPLRRALELPEEWREISEMGKLSVTVPSWVSITQEHLDGRPFAGQDWDRCRHGLWGAAKFNLAAPQAPADAEEAIAYAERIQSCQWLREELEERKRRQAEQEEREEKERPAREERERAESAEREEREVREREKREAQARRAEARKAQIGELFGAPGHPERLRFDEGATSQEEEEALIEVALTGWLPEPDPETGAFRTVAASGRIASTRPGYRWTSKVPTGQEAFGFFRALEARAKAWVAEAPGHRSVELWRAACEGGSIADVRVTEGELEWEGWISLGGNP